MGGNSKDKSSIIGGYFGNIHLALGLFAGSGILVFSGYALVCLRLINMPFRAIFKPLVEFIPFSILAAFILLLIRTTVHPSPLLMTTVGGIAAVGYAVVFLRKGILKSLD